VFGLVLCGWMAGRMRLVGAESSDALNQFVYYFALPLLVGYAPQLMSKRVFGVVNLAYLFALSQFFMAWLIAALYVRAAGRFDAMAHNILNKLKGGADAQNRIDANRSRNSDWAEAAGFIGYVRWSHRHPKRDPAMSRHEGSGWSTHWRRHEIPAGRS